MKKLLLLLALLAAPTLIAQIDTQKLVAGIGENQDLNKLDSIARSLHYKGGDVIRVLAQFTIDEEGNVTKISARGPHPAFEAEAIRIIKLLPQMDPPMYEGKPVARRFSLPIKFRIETEKEKKKRLKRERKKAAKSYILSTTYQIPNSKLMLLL